MKRNKNERQTKTTKYSKTGVIKMPQNYKLEANIIILL